MERTGIRVAINGFGRIGRQVLRQIARSAPDIDVVVVNSVRAKPDLLFIPGLSRIQHLGLAF